MTAIGYLALAEHYYIFFKTGLQGSCVCMSVSIRMAFMHVKLMFPTRNENPFSLSKLVVEKHIISEIFCNIIRL